MAPVLFEGASSIRDVLFMTDTLKGQENITSVRYKNFKAYTRTYAQAGCREPAGKVTNWPDYLVFDLDVDPAESTPITPSAAVMDAIWAAHNTLLLDIQNTFRSVANYSKGSMVNDSPCCNATNAVCRCDAKGINEARETSTRL